MLSEISGFEEIYIACGRSALRKGIDGLATLIKENFGLSLFQKNVLFLFCGSRQDRFKDWYGKEMVLYSSINGSKPEDSAGPDTIKKRQRLQRKILKSFYPEWCLSLRRSSGSAAIDQK